jgi:hypothetical protein
MCRCEMFSTLLQATFQVDLQVFMCAKIDKNTVIMVA